MERSASCALGAAALCTLAVPSLSSDLERACSKISEAAVVPLLPRRCSDPTAITTSVAATCDQQPQRAQRPVSVVVGAGPAGILTAVVLARRGHQVHVYERRPSPLDPLSPPSADDSRAFVVGLNERGRAALQAAGFDVPALAGPGSGIQPVSAVDVTLPGAPARQLRFAEPWLVGPRQAFCGAMLAQAQAMHPRAIAWHWGTCFEGADLAARTAAFAACPAANCSSDDCSDCGSAANPASHHSHTRRYDLLVAADGGWSRVRRAAAAQVPPLAATAVEPSPVQYKVFRGLPPSPALPVGPAAGASSSSAGSDEAGPKAAAASSGKEQPPQLRVLFASGPGLPHPAAIFLSCDPADGSARGILSMAHASWRAAGLAGGACAGAHAAFLARHFPALPPEWLLPMAAQLAEHPLWTAGVRVHAPQLHGPHLLLVGDAGHGVTPRTGNGMNAALQDAAVVDQLLAESGNLATLPERFTAARLEDAHALLWLDGTASARGGTSRWGRAHPLALSSLASALVRSALTRATGGWVAPPAAAELQRGAVPYSTIRRQIQRDAALCAVLATGALAALASACLRRR